MERPDMFRQISMTKIVKTHSEPRTAFHTLRKDKTENAESFYCQRIRAFNHDMLLWNFINFIAEKLLHSTECSPPQISLLLNSLEKLTLHFTKYSLINFNERILNSAMSHRLLYNYYITVLLKLKSEKFSTINHWRKESEKTFLTFRKIHLNFFRKSQKEFQIKFF